MRCDFVGHPVVAEAQPTPSDIEVFRAANGLGSAPLTLVLPGSRQNEVSRLAPIFGKAIHCNSSLLSPQSLYPLHLNNLDTQRPFLHWNTTNQKARCLQQKSCFRLNTYCLASISIEEVTLENHCLWRKLSVGQRNICANLSTAFPKSSSSVL